MNKEVHVDHPAGGAGHVDKGEPAEGEREDVVHPVQGDQL